jgi:hypothetical protein
MNSKQGNCSSLKNLMKRINQILQDETRIYEIFEIYEGVLEYENHKFPDVNELLSF